MPPPLVPATWTVQVPVCSCQPTTVLPGLPETCVDFASLTDLRTAQLSRVTLVMLQPGLEAPCCLPLSLVCLSPSPPHLSLPYTQELASPVPLQSHVCSGHVLMGISIPPTLLPMNRGCPAPPTPPLFSVLGCLSVPTELLLPSETYVCVSLASLGSQTGTMSRAARLTRRPGMENQSNELRASLTKWAIAHLLLSR